MLGIAPLLLGTSIVSPYQGALKNRYRWLSFEPGLERLYQDHFADSHHLRMQLAGYVAIVLFGLFVVVDVTTLPERVWVWTASIRVGLVLTFAITVWVGYHRQWHRAYRVAVLLASLIGSLGTVAVIGVGLQHDFRFRTRASC